MPKIQVKICGVKTKEALEAAAKGGVAFVGFNFYRASPRYVFPDQAAQLAKIAPASLKIVAVTADAEDRIFEDIFERFTPDALQFHGKEKPERVAELKAKWRVPVYRAFNITTAADFEAVKAYGGIADRYLFEGVVPKGSALPGGNASSFDWKLLQGRTFNKPWFLAGGLNAKNIREAIELSGATAVDVSSGVESAPGEKSPEMIGGLLRLLS